MDIQWMIKSNPTCQEEFRDPRTLVVPPVNPIFDADGDLKQAAGCEDSGSSYLRAEDGSCDLYLRVDCDGTKGLSKLFLAAYDLSEGPVTVENLSITLFGSCTYQASAVVHLH